MRLMQGMAIVLIAFGGDGIASPSPDAFGALPDFHDAAISPDASQIAMIVNVDGEYAVQVITIGAQDEPVSRRGARGEC